MEVAKPGRRHLMLSQIASLDEVYENVGWAVRNKDGIHLSRLRVPCAQVSNARHEAREEAHGENVPGVYAAQIVRRDAQPKILKLGYS